MKLHRGAVANPVEIITTTRGYRFKDHDAPEVFVTRPLKITRRVRRMFGLSSGRWFVGVMIFEQPTSK